MTCNDIQELLPLFLYGELSFEEEDGLEIHLRDCEACRQALHAQEALHAALDREECYPAAEFTSACRRELRARVEESRAMPPGFWARCAEAFSIRMLPAPAALLPLAALSLVGLGFFGSRVLPMRFGMSGLAEPEFGEPVAKRVRYLEPESPGRVQIVVEETRQRLVSGDVGDATIQGLLLAAKDSADPGVRVTSVDILKDRSEFAEVRQALLSVLERDPNAGVRLKALEGLKDFAGDPGTRQVLSHVLLNDTNPGVRAQIIDLLIQHKGDRTVGTIQELMRKEDNKYILQRGRTALHEWNASEETF